MTKYLLQTQHPGTSGLGITVTLATDQQIIDAVGFSDCTGDEHAVFAVSEFGQVEQLTEADTPDMPSNYHKFMDSNGKVVFGGFHVAH